MHASSQSFAREARSAHVARGKSNIDPNVIKTRDMTSIHEVESQITTHFQLTPLPLQAFSKHHFHDGGNKQLKSARNEDNVGER